VSRLDLDPAPRFGGTASKLTSLGIAAAVLPLARMQGHDRLYLAPHSGVGLVFSALISGLGRALGYRIYVHYHSFKNIGRRTRLMAAFVKVCGRRAVHVVLGPPMAEGLRRHYPETGAIAVLSNAVFLPERAPPAPRTGPLRIGHLSNLSRVKGLDRVIAVMRALRRAEVDVELVLAGPTTDAEAQGSVEAAQAEFGERLIYLGPVAQSDLEQFYGAIDCFLFPTLYEHEAEPLVVIEALSFAVPVLATDRGCIRNLVGAGGGRVFDGEGFVAGAVELLLGWANDRERLRSGSEMARARFVDVRARAQADLDRLLVAMAESGSRIDSMAGHKMRG
jgi:glycosyltransferase involved in cell wall biosynthesis